VTHEEVKKNISFHYPTKLFTSKGGHPVHVVAAAWEIVRENNFLIRATVAKLGTRAKELL